MLAILANFETDGAVLAIKRILQEVKSFSEGDLAEGRYFNQLRVLVQLRNLEQQFEEAMETITKFFKEEKDPLFRKGEGTGREKEKRETALKMKRSGLAVELIADITGLSIAEIEKLIE